MWASSTEKSCMHLHHQCFLCGVPSPGCGHPPPKSPACTCTISTFCAAFLLLHVGILHRKVLHALAPSALSAQHSFSCMWASSTKKCCMHLHHQHFLCSIPLKKERKERKKIFLHVGILHREVLHALAPSALFVQHSFSCMWASSTEESCMHLHQQYFLCSVLSRACGHSPPCSAACMCRHVMHRPHIHLHPQLGAMTRSPMLQPTTQAC